MPGWTLKTRDLYRKEIETLSSATDIEESELAEIVLKLARSRFSNHPLPVLKDIAPRSFAPSGKDEPEMPLKGDPGTCDHAAHVGEILLGSGRPVLDQQIGYRPKSATALRRWIFRHASFVYLTGVLLLTIFIYTALYLVSNLPGLIGGSSSFSGNFLEVGMPLIPGTPGVLIVVILITFVSLIPVLTVATSLVNWIITLLVKPRILPKLDFRKGFPNDSRHWL